MADAVNAVEAVFANYARTMNWSEQGPEVKARAAALARLRSTPVPSKREEYWKYFSPQALLGGPVSGASLENATPSPAGPVASIATASPATTATWSQNLAAWSATKALRITFLNGKIWPQLSDLAKLPGEFSMVNTLGEVSLPEGLLGSKAYLVHQNEVFQPFEARLKIAEKTLCDAPILVSWISTEGSAQFPRLVVDAGAFSEVTLIEQYLGGNETTVINSYSEVRLGFSAHAQWVQLQNLDSQAQAYGFSRAIAGASAQLRHFHLARGGRLSRRDLHLDLGADNAEVFSGGVVVGRGNQVFDSQGFIHHRTGGNRTRQLYKTVLADLAQSSFTGKVRMDHGAQGAASEQLNKNLLLSPRAKANSRPELEIFTDDVKATHGSTTGRVDEDEMFYLLSRGISFPDAVEMLRIGFVGEVLNEITNLGVRAVLFAALAENLMEARA